jgi:hypothetical protein
MQEMVRDAEAGGSNPPTPTRLPSRRIVGGGTQADVCAAIARLIGVYTPGSISDDRFSTQAVMGTHGSRDAG